VYSWLCSRLPASLVNLTYRLWYAGLILLLVYFWERPAAAFLYLHQ